MDLVCNICSFVDDGYDGRGYWFGLLVILLFVIGNIWEM